MGAGPLITVGADFDEAAARDWAVHGVDVLEARREVGTLEEALEGCGLVVGTTARTGAYRSDCRPVRVVASELVGAENAAGPEGLPSAFVFGPEDRGLSNHDVARCHRLAVIPTAPDYISLNLAQAVLLCLYEVNLARMEAAAAEAPPVAVSTEQADASAAEAMLVAMEEALLTIGFLSEDNPEHIMATIRRIFGRAGLDPRDVRTLHGLARQIRWFAEGGREVAATKRAEGKKLR